MTERPLLSIYPAIRDDIADLTTRRPLPGRGVPHLDPFLFLNHHGPQTYPPRNHGLPFGPHPHRGFETVTFVLAGSLAHSDSSGAQSVVKDGGVQWMTAGSGIVHSELSPDTFKQEGGPLEILQLWVNLPAALKFTEPAYREVPAKLIPEVDLREGATLRPVSGFDDAPVDSLTGIALGTLTLEAGTEISLPIPSDHTIFFYTIRGEAKAGGATVPEHHLATFGSGEHLVIAAEKRVQILLGHAEPIGEPIVAHGPFVMNSEREIVEAFEAYRRGEFA